MSVVESSLLRGITDGSSDWENIPDVIRNTIFNLSNMIANQSTEISTLKKHINKLYRSNLTLSNKIDDRCFQQQNRDEPHCTASRIEIPTKDDILRFIDERMESNSSVVDHKVDKAMQLSRIAADSVEDLKERIHLCEERIRELSNTQSVTSTVPDLSKEFQYNRNVLKQLEEEMRNQVMLLEGRCRSNEHATDQILESIDQVKQSQRDLVSENLQLSYQIAQLSENKDNLTPVSTTDLLSQPQSEIDLNSKFDAVLSECKTIRNFVLNKFDECQSNSQPPCPMLKDSLSQFRQEIEDKLQSKADSKHMKQIAWTSKESIKSITEVVKSDRKFMKEAITDVRQVVSELQKRIDELQQVYEQVPKEATLQPDHSKLERWLDDRIASRCLELEQMICSCATASDIFELKEDINRRASRDVVMEMKRDFVTKEQMLDKLDQYHNAVATTYASKDLLDSFIQSAESRLQTRASLQDVSEIREIWQEWANQLAGKVDNVEFTREISRLECSKISRRDMNTIQETFLKEQNEIVTQLLANYPTYKHLAQALDRLNSDIQQLVRSKLETKQFNSLVAKLELRSQTYNSANESHHSSSDCTNDSDDSFDQVQQIECSSNRDEEDREATEPRQLQRGSVIERFSTVTKLHSPYQSTPPNPHRLISHLVANDDL